MVHFKMTRVVIVSQKLILRDLQQHQADCTQLEKITCFQWLREHDFKNLEYISLREFCLVINVKTDKIVVMPIAAIDYKTGVVYTVKDEYTYDKINDDWVHVENNIVASARKITFPTSIGILYSKRYDLTGNTQEIDGVLT